VDVKMSEVTLVAVLGLVLMNGRELMADQVDGRLSVRFMVAG